MSRIQGYFFKIDQFVITLAPVFSVPSCPVAALALGESLATGIETWHRDVKKRRVAALS